MAREARFRLGHTFRLLGIGLLALAITLFAGAIWTLLLLTNLHADPAIPWSVPVMAILLCAIWMAGSGIASDGKGYIYVMTSNGDWDGVSNFGESFVKLHSNLSGVYDYFTSYQQATFSSQDQDVGSGGMLLLPPQAGAVPNEVVGCGKPRAIYLVDRDNMGKFQTNTNSQIVQEVDGAVGGLSGQQAPDSCFTTPAYWQGNLYFSANNDTLKAFNLYVDPTDNKTKICAASTSTVMCKTSKSAYVFGFPGTQPAVSSNGSSNGIVWAVDYSSFSPSGSTILHAFSATNLGTELYRSSGLGASAKFAAPTVINGKVYLGNRKCAVCVCIALATRVIVSRDQLQQIGSGKNR